MLVFSSIVPEQQVKLEDDTYISTDLEIAFYLKWGKRSQAFGFWDPLWHMPWMQW